MCFYEISDPNASKPNALAPGRHGSASEISRDASGADISDPYKVQMSTSSALCVN